MSAEDSPGWYLYGVVDGDAAVSDGTGIVLVREGPVAGVASRVSLAATPSGRNFSATGWSSVRSSAR